MKTIILFLFLFAALIPAIAQEVQVGSKVTFKATDLQMHTGTVTKIKGDAYYIHYDDVQNFSAWLAYNQFKLVGQDSKPPLPKFDENAPAVVGSKVQIVAVDGKLYIGTIREIQNNKYNVHYEFYDFDAWLTRNQFQIIGQQPVVTTNQQPAEPVKTQQVNRQINQPVNNVKGNTVGVLYSGYSGNGWLYYYMLPSGKIIRGCPKGGLENFNANAYCAQNVNSCGTYTKSATSINIRWDNGGSVSGKVKPNSDIDIGGSFMGTMKKVPAAFSGSYEFTVSIGGTSVAEVMHFKEDGSYQTDHVSGVYTGGADRNGQNNSSESSSTTKGRFKINGYTITLIDNNGDAVSHTIYCIDGSKNPDDLGWDGNFLTRKK